MAKKQESGKISKRMQRRAEQRKKKRQTQLLVGAVAIVLLVLVGWAMINGFSGELDSQSNYLGCAYPGRMGRSPCAQYYFDSS